MSNWCLSRRWWVWDINLISILLNARLVIINDHFLAAFSKWNCNYLALSHVILLVTWFFFSFLKLYVCFISEQSQKVWPNAEWHIPWFAVSNWKLQSVSLIESYFLKLWLEKLYVFLLSRSSSFFSSCCDAFRYGYLTNTKVKFMVVTTDLDVRDTDVRNVSFNFLVTIFGHWNSMIILLRTNCIL